MIATSSGTRLAGRLWFLIFLGAAMLASHVEVRADGNSTSTSASNTSSNSTNTTMAPSTTTTPNTTVAPSNATTPPPSTSNSNATTAAPTNNSSTNAPSATNMTNTTTGAPNSTNTTTNTTSTPSPQNGGTPTAPPDANVGAYSCNGLTLRQDLSFRSATTVTINGCVVASLNFYDTAPGAKITITNTQAVGGGIYFYGGLRGSSSLTVSNSDISDPVATGVQTALLEIWGGVNESSSVTISGNSIHTEQSRFTSAVRFAASDSAVVSITYNNVAWLNSATAALFNISAVSGAQVTVSYNTLKLGNCQEGTLLMAPWVVKATYTASHNIFSMGKIAFMSGISIGLLRPASIVNIENNTIVSDTSTVIGLGCGICITGGAGADVWSSWTPTSLTIRYNRVTFQATSSTSVGFSLQDVHNAKVQLLSNNITVTSLLNAATGILVSASPFNSTLAAATKMDAALWNFNANYFSNILVILGVTCIGISIAPTMNAVTSIQNQSITAAGIASSSSSVAVAGIVFTGGVYAGSTNVAGGLQTNLTIGPGSNSISSTMATLNGVADFVAALYCPNGGSMLQQSNLLVQNVAFAQYVPAVKAVVGLSLPGVSSGSATITQNSVTVVNGQPYATTLYAIGCEVSGLSLTSHIAASGTGSNLYFAFNFGRIDTTAVNAPSASYRALQIGVALGAVTSKALANVFNNDLRLFFLEGAVRSGDSVAVLPLEVSSGATFLVSNNLLQGSTPMTSCLCSNSNGGYGQCSGSIIPDCSVTGVSFSAITSNAYVSASVNRYTVPNASQAIAYLVKQLTGGSAFVLSSDIISVNALLIPLFYFGTIQASTVYMASLSATYALSTSLFTATVPNAALYVSHADAGASINMTSSSITTSSTVLTSATLFNPGINIGSPDSSGAGYVAFGSSSNKLDSFSYLNVPATLPTGATLYAMSTCDSYLKGNSVTSSSISKGVTLLTCSGSGTSTPSERMAILNLNIDPSSFKSAVFASALASTMGLTPSAVIVTSVTALPTGSALGLTQVTVQFQTSAAALQAESLTASQKTSLGVTSAIAATDAPTTAPPPPAIGGDNVVALVVGLTVGSVVMLGLGLVVARTMGGNDDKRRKGNDDNEHSQPLNGRKKGGGLNNVLKVETAAAPPPPPPPPPATINLDDDLL